MLVGYVEFLYKQRVLWWVFNFVWKSQIPFSECII